MTNLVISLEASRDLSEISDYFLSKSVDAGDRFVTAFEKKCQHLATYPYLGRSYQKIMPGLRGLPLLSTSFSTRFLKKRSKSCESSVVIAIFPMFFRGLNDLPSSRLVGMIRFCWQWVRNGCSR